MVDGVFTLRSGRIDKVAQLGPSALFGQPGRDMKIARCCGAPIPWELCEDLAQSCGRARFKGAWFRVLPHLLHR